MTIDGGRPRLRTQLPFQKRAESSSTGQIIHLCCSHHFRVWFSSSLVSAAPESLGLPFQHPSCNLDLSFHLAPPDRLSFFPLPEKLHAPFRPKSLPPTPPTKPQLPLTRFHLSYQNPTLHRSAHKNPPHKHAPPSRGPSPATLSQVLGYDPPSRNHLLHSVRGLLGVGKGLLQGGLEHYLKRACLGFWRCGGGEG